MEKFVIFSNQVEVFKYKLKLGRYFLNLLRKKDGR